MAVSVALIHQYEQLTGRLNNRLSDCIDDLGVALTALGNNTPRVDVAAERIDATLKALQRELAHMNAVVTRGSQA